MQPIITTTETTLRGQSSILPPNILVSLFCYIFSNKGVEVPADKGVKISRYRFSYDEGQTWNGWFNGTPDPSIFLNDPNGNFIFEFEKVDLSLLDNYPVFEKLLFSQFFDFWDDRVLNWAFNVLEKLYAPGIIPLYIERNLDFCSYWLAICHNFAFIEQYGTKFGQIDTNEILFNKFLNERGLITTTVDSTDQRQYLFFNYIKEYIKRGKLSIAEKGKLIENSVNEIDPMQVNFEKVYSSEDNAIIDRGEEENYLSYFKVQNSELNFPGGRTIELYFSLRNTGEDIQVILWQTSYQRSLNVYYYKDKSISLVGGVNGNKRFVITNNISFDKKYHVVISYFNLVATIYLDGILVGSLNLDSEPDWRGDYFLGNSSTNPEPSFTGEIIENRLFSRYLNSTEATALYNSGNPLNYVLPSILRGNVQYYSPALNSTRPFNVTNEYFLRTVSTDGKTARVEALQELNSTNVTRAYADFGFLFNGQLASNPLYVPFELDMVFKVQFKYKSNCPLQIIQRGGYLPIFTNNLPANDTESYIEGVGYFKITAVTTDFNGVLISYKGVGVTYPNNTIPAGTYIDITDVRVSRAGCIAEYLPQGVTETMWKDSSGNGLDLIEIGKTDWVSFGGIDISGNSVKTCEIITDLESIAASPLFPFQQGESYVITMDIRSDNIVELNSNYLISSNSGNISLPSFSISSTWKTYSFNVENYPDGSIRRIGYGVGEGNNGKSFQLRNIFIKKIIKNFAKNCISGYIPVTEGESYTISPLSGINIPNMVYSGGYFSNKEEESISSIIFTNSSDNKGRTFTVPFGQQIKFVIINLYRQSIFSKLLAADFQLENGTKVTNYQPYSPFYEINGEFLRLIRFSNEDEFIFSTFAPQDTGWCLAHSSPTWSSLQTITSVDKSKGDISRYPIVGAVSIANGVLYPNATTKGSGIGANTDNSLLFPLNTGKSYEISFLLRVSSDTANKIQNLKFGVDVFDVNYSPVTCTMMNDTRDATNYFHTGEFMPQLVNQNVKDGYSDFLVRAVVKNFAFNENFALRWPDGYALRWPSNAKWFTPKIVQVSGGDITPVQILNVTVKPQTLSYTDKTIPYGFSQGFMGTKNIIASFIVNNSYYSQSEIKEFTKRYLIDYKNIILIEYLSIGEEPYFMFSKHEDRLAAAGTPPVVNEIQTNKNWVLTLGN